MLNEETKFIYLIKSVELINRTLWQGFYGQGIYEPSWLNGQIKAYIGRIGLTLFLMSVFQSVYIEQKY